MSALAPTRRQARAAREATAGTAIATPPTASTAPPTADSASTPATAAVVPERTRAAASAPAHGAGSRARGPRHRATWQAVPARRRQRAERRHRRVGVAAGLAIVLTAVVGIGITAALILQVVLVPANGAAQADEPRPEYAEPDAGGDPVEQAAQEEAGGSYTPPAPAAGQPLHLAIPSVGLDANVGSMGVPTTRVIDPPTANSAYWVRDYSGAGPDATGTAYIAGHTFRGSGTAVFNPLFDRDTRESRIHEGDAIEVTTPEGTYTYTVTAVANYEKGAVVSEGELWQDVPGRLVLVACWYNGDSATVANMVVYAQLVAP